MKVISYAIQKSLLIILLIGTISSIFAQDLDITGKVKIKSMDKYKSADSLVVLLPDGTLAIRVVSSLPDADSTNELQSLSIANDVLSISGNANQVDLSPYKPSFELDTDTLSTDKRVGIGTNSPLQKLDVKGGIKGDSLFITGKIKVNVTDKINTADSVVVRLADGTLAIRDVSTLPTNSGGWTFVPGGSDQTHLTLSGTTMLVFKRNSLGDLMIHLPNLGSSDNLFLGNSSGQSIMHIWGHDGYFNTGIGNYALPSNSTGSFNTAVGRSSLLLNTEGNFNTGIGTQALLNNSIGSNNTALGFNTLFDNKTGSSNLAIGNESLRNNTSGSGNLGIGAGHNIDYDGEPIYYGALGLNKTGSDNLAIGTNSIIFNQANSRSMAIGHWAMQNADSTSNGHETFNTAIGYKSLMGGANPSLNTGIHNTAVGDLSMSENTEGYNNAAFGSGSMQSNTSGFRNTSVGAGALGLNTTGNSNTALGQGALSSNVGKSESTAIGRDAMRNADNSSSAGTTGNSAFGYRAMYGSVLPANNTGTNNTIVGHNALSSYSSGSYNTGVGKDALSSIVGGYFNIGVGSFALLKNVSGGSNIAIGHSALENSENSSNVAIGHEAGKTTVGSSNIFIGYNAGKTATGDNKLFIHNQDADSDSSLIYGEFDTKVLNINGRTVVLDSRTQGNGLSGIKNYALGTNSNVAGVFGRNTVDPGSGFGVWGEGGAIGVFGQGTQGVRGEANAANLSANYGVSGVANSGTYNYGVDGFASGTATTNYGLNGYAFGGTTNYGARSQANGGATNYGVSGHASDGSNTNYGVYGNAITDGVGITNYGVYGIAGGTDATNYALYAAGDIGHTGTIYYLSDQKFKSNINDISSVISNIMLLKPSSYTMKSKEFPEMNLPKTEQAGFIAQEMQKVFPALVSEQLFSNIGEDKNSNTKIEYLGVNYIGLIPILTKGMQEQQGIIENLNKTVHDQFQEIEALKKRMTNMESFLSNLAEK